VIIVTQLEVISEAYVLKAHLHPKPKTYPWYQLINQFGVSEFTTKKSQLEKHAKYPWQCSEFRFAVFCPQQDWGVSLISAILGKILFFFHQMLIWTPENVLLGQAMSCK
jgi:hypothetical protein